MPKKEYYIKNKKRVIEYNLEWMRNNPDKTKKYLNNWRLKNRDYVNNEQRGYRAKHKQKPEKQSGYFNKWYQKNKEEFNMTKMEKIKKLREDIFNKYGGRCAYCGRELKAVKNMQVDHIFPRHKKHWIGNEEMREYDANMPENIDDIKNLNPSCRYCNVRKSAFSLEQFRSEIAKQVERANRYSANYRLAKMYNLVIETGEEVKFYFENF